MKLRFALLLAFASSSTFALEPGVFFFTNRLPLTVFDGSSGLIVGTNGFQVTGPGADAELGTSVALPGDVNGDGLGDVLIGAPKVAGAAGRAYLIWGRRSYPPQFDASSLASTNALVLHGANALDELGTAVSGAGDVNDDGFPDIALGAPINPTSARTNYVVVVFGGTNLAGNLAATDVNGTNGFLCVAPPSSLAGASLTALGDINGDGFDDLAVGAREADRIGVTNGGAVYLLFGRTNWPAQVDLAQLNGTNGSTLLSEANLNRFGWSVAALPDFNGDGLRDILVGAPSVSTSGFPIGRAYVIAGRTNWAAQLVVTNLAPVNGLQLNGIEINGSAGTTVAGGDINGDGLSDAVVGSPGNNGKVAILFGSTNLAGPVSLAALNGTNGFTLITTNSASRLGGALAAGVDLDSDGRRDLLAGASDTTISGQSKAGTAYLLFGQSTYAATVDVTRLNGTNGFAILGVQASGEVGWSLDMGPDVNGDTYPDLVLGARRFTAPGPITNAGMASVLSLPGITTFTLGIPVLTEFTQANGTQTVVWASQSGAAYDVFTNGTPETTAWGFAATVTSGGSTTVWNRALSGQGVSLIRVHARR